MVNKSPDSGKQITAIAQNLIDVVKTDADAAIGYVHLQPAAKMPSTATHPVYTGILVYLLSLKLDFSPDECRDVLVANLLSNVASIRYQEKLNQHKGKLTEQQLALIRKHPEQSAEIAKDAGITKETILTFIKQHHERPDGSGYPAGISGEELRLEAKIIGVADMYVAMISRRAYRNSTQAKEALREILIDSKDTDMNLYATFIKELGVYPPGTFVKLASGDIAVVARRNFENSTLPEVKGIIQPRGAYYLEPRNRDVSETDFAIREVYFPKKKLTFSPSLVWPSEE